MYLYIYIFKNFFFIINILIINNDKSLKDKKKNLYIKTYKTEKQNQK